MKITLKDLGVLPNSIKITDCNFVQTKIAGKAFNECLTQCENIDISDKVTLDREKLVFYLKDLLLTPKKIDPKPTIAELEKILNSSEGQSLMMMPNGEIGMVRPSFSLEKIADAIIKELPKLLIAKSQEHQARGSLK